MRRRRWLAQMLIVAAAGLILSGWLPESFRLKAEATPTKRATAEATQTTRTTFHRESGGHELRDQAGAVRFVDVTAKAGITFVHASAASPEKYMFETFGSGVAWIDFDNDGFVNL